MYKRINIYFHVLSTWCPMISPQTFHTGRAQASPLGATSARNQLPRGRKGNDHQQLTWSPNTSWGLVFGWFLGIQIPPTPRCLGLHLGFCWCLSYLSHWSHATLGLPAPVIGTAVAPTAFTWTKATGPATFTRQPAVKVVVPSFSPKEVAVWKVILVIVLLLLHVFLVWVLFFLLTCLFFYHNVHPLSSMFHFFLFSSRSNGPTSSQRCCKFESLGSKFSFPSLSGHFWYLPRKNPFRLPNSHKVLELLPVARCRS